MGGEQPRDAGEVEPYERWLTGSLSHGTPLPAHVYWATEETYSVAETARLIGKSESGVRRIVDRGALRVTHDAKGRMRILASDVERLRTRGQTVAQQPLFGSAAVRRDWYGESPSRQPAANVANEPTAMGEIREMERTISELRAEVARLRGALEGLLIADAAKKDAISQLLLEDGNWAR